MKKIKILSIFAVLALLLSFAQTGSASQLTATSPTLGAAGTFSVLAETTITNVPTSAIGADVGLSPASGAGIGLTDPEVAGTIYAVDGFGPAGSVVNPGLLTQAVSDMMGAYTFLDQGCDVTYAGVQDLTLVSPLVAGTYCADAFILTGNLTLSGSGVWIFKSASTLTTSAGSTVTGGDPCNVWWRLGTAADLFPNSSVIGSILAGTSINMQTGADLNGRALAQAAVTLDSNNISIPVCAVAPSATPTSTSTATATATSTATATITVTGTVATATVTATGTVPTATGTVAPATATLLPIVTALPDTGGAPIRSQNSPWVLVVLGSFGFMALGLIIRGFLRTYRAR